MLPVRWRQIYTSAILYSRKSNPTIKFPITLHLCLPPYSNSPLPFKFNSFGEIKEFLQPKRFLLDPLSNEPIIISQVERINPDRVYDLVGVDFTYCPSQKGSREQVPVVDKVFEEKAVLALKELLKKEDPGIVELPRVVQDKAGKDVGEWAAIFESSDGCIIFLEAKFRMLTVSIVSMFIPFTKLYQDHVVEQSEHMSRSLRALGKQNRAKLFLAAYFWQDDKNCISFTCQLGYGIIQPNLVGKGLTVEVMAEGMCICFCSEESEIQN